MEKGRLAVGALGMDLGFSSKEGQNLSYHNISKL